MENIETEVEKNKVVDRKEVIVQTEPVSIKSKDCESSMDDPNENLGIAVSVQTEEHGQKELECPVCSKNFRTKRDFMTHMKATHKDKVKICSKFAAGIHCSYGSEGC